MWVLVLHLTPVESAHFPAFMFVKLSTHLCGSRSAAAAAQKGGGGGGENMPRRASIFHTEASMCGTRQEQSAGHWTTRQRKKYAHANFQETPAWLMEYAPPEKGFFARVGASDGT